MRKTSTIDATKYPPIWLYRDDIVQIANLLKEHCTDVDITIGEYELDDVSELDKITKSRVTKCTIKAGTKSPIGLWTDDCIEVNINDYNNGFC